MSTAPGQSLFGLPIDTNASMTRALIDHGDGTWTTTVFSSAVQKANPKRPTEQEIRFSIAEVMETAAKVFSHEFFTQEPEGSKARAAFDKRKRTLLILASFALQMLHSSGAIEALEELEKRA